MIKVAILGLGTVGTGVAKLLDKKAKLIEQRSGQAMTLKYIVDIRDFKDSPFSDRIVKDFSIVENDPEIDVVVETIGGTGVAYDFTKRALLAGKHVVTPNKDVVAKYGAELLKIAHDKGLYYMFEGAVGGVTPVLFPLRQYTMVDNITEIYGIMNGTTNYILTKMVHENMSFADALKLSQDLGYAEADPAADIEGMDTCRKICILSAIAYGRHFYPDTVNVEGITKVELEDISYTHNNGKAIKLVGRSLRRQDGKVYIYVAPHVISEDSPLSNIVDVFNGIMIHGEAVDDIMFYGRGSGSFTTGSAIISDIVYLAQHMKDPRPFVWDDADPNMMADLSEMEESRYIRARGLKKAEAEKYIEGIFGSVDILEKDGAPDDEIVFISGKMAAREIQKKEKEISGKMAVKASIRVL